MRIDLVGRVLSITSLNKPPSTTLQSSVTARCALLQSFLTIVGYCTLLSLYCYQQQIATVPLSSTTNNKQQTKIPQTCNLCAPQLVIIDATTFCSLIKEQLIPHHL